MAKDKKGETVPLLQKYQSGCMVCGAELLYERDSKKQSCYCCGVEKHTSAVRTNGHFMCDDCH